MTTPRSRRTTAALAGAAVLAAAAAVAVALTNGGSDVVVGDGGATPAASPSAAAPSTPAGSSPSPRASAPTTSPTTGSAGPVVSPVPATPPTQAGPSAAPQGERPTLILEGDGLGFLVGEASIRRFPFETTDAEQTIEAVRRALGEVTLADQPDCGPGLSSADVEGFSMLIEGDRVIGWADADAGARRTTADGIGVGSTLSDLRASQSEVTVSDSSLGVRWAGGAYGGLLDGEDDTSRVTRITAGQTCSFG